jgi:5-oxoprolinase (ATP-hydrolysing) subunit A
VAIDLNSDVGEGFPDDEALFAIVTSANVACGFHAGSPETMRAACRSAAGRGVVVGAHPSYRDREGFGRRSFDVAPHVVRSEVAEQVGALASIATAEGVRVAYLKPHGALYHRAAVEAETAAAIVEAASAAGLPVLALPGSELYRQAGLRAVSEGYADRGYTPGGLLVPRGEAGALLGAEAAAEQAVRLAREGAVASLCVHGDAPGAAALAARVRAALVTAGFELQAFA